MYRIEAIPECSDDKSLGNDEDELVSKAIAEEIHKALPIHQNAK